MIKYVAFIDLPPTTTLATIRAVLETLRSQGGADIDLDTGRVTFQLEFQSEDLWDIAWRIKQLDDAAAGIGIDFPIDRANLQTTP